MNLLKQETQPNILLMHGCLESNQILLVMLGMLQDENLFAKTLSLTAPIFQGRDLVLRSAVRIGIQVSKPRSLPVLGD